MKDSYSHTDNNIIYIEECIPGPADNSEDYGNLINEYNSQIIHSCDCDKCTSTSCSCLELSGCDNYIVLNTEIEIGNVTCTLNKSKNNNVGFIMECNDLCKCSDDCNNRLVQKGPVGNLYINNCKNKLKGLGLFTDKFLPQGNFICEYAGELLTKEQAMSRHYTNTKFGKMNYIFCLSEHTDNITLQTFVDPSYFGNIGRYINHSCEPNCEIIPVRFNSPIPKLAIFSLCDISAGRELTYDYGLNNKDIVNPENKKICLCESYNCRTLMPFNFY